MATYAVLGATGCCGSALIDILLRDPDVHINAYCRDRTKLSRRFLDATKANRRIKVFEGRIDDVSLLGGCIRNCRAVFLAVSTNVNIPGCTMAQTTAATVLAALKGFREEAGSGAATVPLPRLVLLSSASLDEKLSRHDPRPLHWVVLRAASYVYKDLCVAEDLLRSQSSWVTTIYMKPAALSVDRQRGHALSLEEADGPLSYLDLAAGMIEAADSTDDYYDQRNVGVINASKGEPAQFAPSAAFRLLVNLVIHFFPFTYPVLRYIIH